MIVYYTWLKQEHSCLPVSLLSELKSPNSKLSVSKEWMHSGIGMMRCPAFVKSIANTFVLKSPINYSFSWDKATGVFSSDMYSQQEFDEFIHIRNAAEGVLSFGTPHYLFCAEEPLVMEVSHATYHNADLQKKTTYLGGSFDIGRHFRNTEAALALEDSCTINIKENDPVCYVRFQTTEPVKLVPFFHTDTLMHIREQIFKAKNHCNPKPLHFWYDLHERIYRKRLLKEIKDNLLG